MDYKLITKREDLVEAFKYIKERPEMFVAFDTETYGPLTLWKKKKSDQYVWEQTAKLAGFSFAYEDKAFYVPVAHTGANYDAEDLKKFLRAFFRIPNRIWGHNLDYDFRVIRNFVGEYLFPERFGDTMVLTWLVGVPFVRFRQGKEIEFYNLKDLTLHHFGHQMQTYAEAIGDVQVLLSGPSDADVEAAAEAALAAYRSEKQLSLPMDAGHSKRELQVMQKARKLAMRERKYRDPQMNDLPADQVCSYACEDAYWTLQLAVRFWARVHDMDYTQQWDRLEMARIVALRRMHDNGIPVSENGAAEIRRICETEYEPLAKEFQELTGCIIDSPQQVANAFYSTLKIVPTDGAPRTKTGALAVDYDALQWIQNHPQCTDLGKKLVDIKLRHALYKKIGSTYTNSLTAQLPYSPDGMVHPRFSITGTRTGRLSCSEPNAQNFPTPSPGIPDVRALVEAPPGHVLFAVDLSQIEIVIMAHLSKDARLTEVILEGKSMHDVTANSLGISRKEAKAVNFLKNYGGGSKKLAISLNVPLEEVEKSDGTTISVAPQYIQDYCAKYDELYEGVTRFRQDMSDFSARKGYVETIGGRRRYLPKMSTLRSEISAMDKTIESGQIRKRSGRWTQENERRLTDLFVQRRKKRLDLYHQERIASNTPIQGSAADIMNAAMVEIDQYLRKEGDATKMILQVHDELVFIAPEERAKKDLDKVVHIMENVVKLSLPVKAEGKIGKKWSECK